MSGGREVAALAVHEIDGLVADMVEVGAQDNEIVLGEITMDGRPVQISLKINADAPSFLDWETGENE